MGYRVKLGKVSRVDYEKYRSIRPEQFAEEFGGTLDKEEGYWDFDVSPYYPPFHTQLIELGKYVAFDKSSRFYQNDGICPYEDVEFHVMTRDQLRAVIDEYYKGTGEYMQDMLACVISLFPEDKRSEMLKEEGVEFSKRLSDDIECGISSPKGELISFFYGMHQEWTRGKDFNVVPFYLDGDDGEVVSEGEFIRSWKIQYAILNLVHLYVSFDWENDVLIYSGW